MGDRSLPTGVLWINFFITFSRLHKISDIINIEIKRKSLTNKQKNRANHNFNDSNQG